MDRWFWFFYFYYPEISYFQSPILWKAYPQVFLKLNSSLQWHRQRFHLNSRFFKFNYMSKIPTRIPLLEFFSQCEPNSWKNCWSAASSSRILLKLLNLRVHWMVFSFFSSRMWEEKQMTAEWRIPLPTRPGFWS